MKIKIRFALILALGLYTSVNLMAQKPSDLVGTWVGMSIIKEMEYPPGELTLVLEMKEGKLTGHMTSYPHGWISEIPISEIKLEEGVFSFHIVSKRKTVTLIFKMKVDSDSMKGDWERLDFDIKGTWEAIKQK